MKRLVSAALAAVTGLALGVLAAPAAGADNETGARTWRLGEGKAVALGVFQGDKIGGATEGFLVAPQGECWEFSTITYKDGEPGEPWHSENTCKSGGLVELKKTISKDPQSGTILMMCGSMCKQICPQDGGECADDRTPGREAAVSERR